MLKPLVIALSVSSTCLVFATAALALRPQPAFVGALPAQPVERTLTLSGTAEVKVVPDVAKVQLTVSSGPRASAADAQARATQQTALILAAVQKLGIAPADVQSGGFTVQPEYTYDARGAPQGPPRWRADRTITLCVYDLTKLQDVVAGALDGNGGARLDAVTYDTTKLDELRKTARALAVRAAKQKAQAMADELSVRVGAPRTIAEAQDTWSGAYTSKNATFDAGGEGTVDGAFAAGKMSVSAQVDVVFDIDA